MPVDKALAVIPALRFRAAGMTLHLARHGQSALNHKSLVTGQLDPVLAPEGEEQARMLATCLAGVRLDAIYASALVRTVQTARPTAVAQGLPIVCLPALNEIHLGVLQGRERDERDPQAQALYEQWRSDMWHVQVPGGERFDAFSDRVTGALEAILDRHAGQQVLLVGHRATNRVLFGTLMDLPRERWPEIRLRNRYAYRLRLGDAPAIDTYALSGGKAGRLLDGFVM